ncbi:Ldh family oxidoreductase [Streptomyces sp. NPDC059788]|uniref:Ldh family oxidoreductase n=1 Tax=Streptomyces sp. NPDC059788 TaxID=3346948 RepID=UPI00364B548E
MNHDTPAGAAPRRIDADAARTLAATALGAAGVPDADAAEVANGLVETSLRGVDTHGLRLLPQYLDELATQVANPTPKFRTVNDHGAGALLDADAALGMVAGLTAARSAAERARRLGAGIVAVRNSNHFGAASVYTRYLADEGLLGIAVTSAASRVAPFGGVEPLFGTNPISVAAGQDGTQLALDMATSQVCFGEIKQRRAEGRPLGPGWATDAAGRTTGEPDAAHALSPLGGYKGQGLAMAVTLLGAVLAGAPTDWRLTQVGGGTPGAGRQIGHLIVALDPAAFAGADAFADGLADLLGTVRSAPRATEAPVLAPGDPQRAHARERTAAGVPLDAATATALDALAARHGLPGCRPDGAPWDADGAVRTDRKVTTA